MLRFLTQNIESIKIDRFMLKYVGCIIDRMLSVRHGHLLRNIIREFSKLV